MSVVDNQGGQWQERKPEPPPAALDPTTWSDGRRAIAALLERIVALEGEVAALRDDVLDLRAQRPG